MKKKIKVTKAMRQAVLDTLNIGDVTAVVNRLGGTCTVNLHPRERSFPDDSVAVKYLMKECLRYEEMAANKQSNPYAQEKLLQAAWAFEIAASNLRCYEKGELTVKPPSEVPPLTEESYEQVKAFIVKLACDEDMLKRLYEDYVAVDIELGKPFHGDAPILSETKESSAERRGVIHGTYRKLNVMRLHDNYNNIEEFGRFDEAYGIYGRFCDSGFEKLSSDSEMGIEELWESNPFYTLDINHGNKITIVKKNATGRWVKA